MGINGLTKLIGHVATTKTIGSFTNKKVAIDSSIYLYRYLYRAQKPSEEFSCILKGFLEQLIVFKKHAVIPLYIFDGYDTAHKRVLEERRKRRETNMTRIQTMKKEIITHRNSIRMLSTSNEVLMTPTEDIVDVVDVDNPEGGEVPEDVKVPEDESVVKGDVCLIFESDSEEDVKVLTTKISNLQSTMKTLEKQVRKPSPEHLIALKEMLDVLNIPYLHSPGESDLVCSLLSRKNIIDAIFSDDTDMLPFRCSTVVSGFKTNNLADLKEYKLDEVLKHLEVTHPEFIDICILSGCDYSQKIDKIAVTKAHQYIKQYKTIEGVVDYINKDPELKEKHPYPDDFNEQYTIARQMFSGEHSHVKELEAMNIESKIIDKLDTSIWDKNMDIDKLDDFLKRFNILKPESVLDKLKNLNNPPKRVCSDAKQKSILSFFQPRPVPTLPAQPAPSIITKY